MVLETCKLGARVAGGAVLVGALVLVGGEVLVGVEVLWGGVSCAAELQAASKTVIKTTIRRIAVDLQ